MSHYEVGAMDARWLKFVHPLDARHFNFVRPTLKFGTARDSHVLIILGVHTQNIGFRDAKILMQMIITQYNPI